MIIGTRIKELRKKLNFTQAELAKKLNISKSMIAMVESGAQSPSFAFIMLLLQQFDCSADWLIQGRGEMFPEKHDKSLDEAHHYRRELIEMFFKTAGIEDCELVLKLMERIIQDYPKENKQ
ncbi:MAG: hypothetical protein CVV44_17230 [Spirochaetae bacterium HGW-Spirochaetae-1]|jgi:transcriptional regulator with XRE-family HTH domain|nr:MAG: hypothetical protein CVV44_17230 [Spirochaetae bacterium HGW-Spirochaetae-1]